jgi:hypothetical protein
MYDIPHNELILEEILKFRELVNRFLNLLNLLIIIKVFLGLGAAK